LAKKIRVYELARELGLSNKEALDLCESLGIGVKSHSSSIEDAQADRVRRKADREGLRRQVAPEETPEPAKKATSRASAGARPTARSARSPGGAEPKVGPPAGGAEPTPVDGGAPLAPAASAEVAPPPERRLVTSRPASEVPVVAPRPAARRTAPPPAARPAPAAGAEPAAAAAPAAPPRRAKEPPAPAKEPSAPREGSARPPLSPTGKPIPPPPVGPPRSATGRPIPPPPGLGGRRQAPPGSRPAGPGGPRTTGGGRPPGAGRSGGGFAGPRTSGGFGPGRPSFGGGRPGGPGGRGAPGGPPPGLRGGPGGRGRPPQRRPRRRRRHVEELEPTQLTTYVPSNAPVPEGEVIVERGSTAQDLGPKLNRSAGDVVRFLLLQGEMVTATQSLSDDMIELFAAELGAKIRLVDAGEEQEAALQAKYFDDEDEEDASLARPRPPVVTVMGHVDHGKTKLLDRIRETNVVAGEAGGITQHIGAYQVERDGHLITFIDTPGHEAFTAMRARGAEVTDVVILVVAADDGVMPQTVEALDHAKAAQVPVLVAINKIDREDADQNRVMQQLSDHDLVPEQWGGDTIMVGVSALENIGIDELLDQLNVLAEVQELTANPEGRARGVVLEANLDVGRGPVATVIVQKGMLRVGDFIVAGAAWGRVKALVDDRGDNVKEAGPSTPVQVLGLSEPPSAGDELRATPDQATARTIGEAREQRLRFAGYTAVPSAAPGAKLEDIFEQIQRGEKATLNLILKADVQGSLEALTEALRKLERDEVKLGIVHRGVGGITENDVQLASASTATIIGFNVRPDRRARELAADQGVEIRTYEVIYKVLEEIEAAMVGMLAPEFEEIVTGEAEVREIFRVPRVGAVAGCYVRNGVITRGSKVRFLREGVIIWKGSVSSLKRFKDDVREVQSGFECGIGLSDFQDLKQGDVIETYEEREIPRT
jgi:translation initiation factor IF-2